MKFQRATKTDIPAIVALLADDVLGAKRELLEDPVNEKYTNAFDEIMRQTGNQIIVAIDDEGKICGCMQLTFTTGLARQGMKRATIEGVRIAKNMRGEGLGKLMFQDAFERARNEGCCLVQLTTDIMRKDAHNFYADLGFEASHAGLKLML